MKYTPTIGLEIHVQLKTKSKMFCGCDNVAEGKEPNTTVCPVCMGFPGVLPVPNKQALEWAVKLGKFLNSEVSKETKFDRKHYFYPDLPKGYQISQYDQPIISGGKVNIDGRDIHLERIHLEEDAGKLVHASDGGSSLVDLNRAGTPLLEVVTKPEIISPEEAKKFMQRLRLVVRYLGISDGDMEKGHLRCDANISIASVTSDPPRVDEQTRVEAGKWQVTGGIQESPITNHKSPVYAEASVDRQNNGVAASQSSTPPTPPLDKGRAGRDVLGTPVEIKNLNSFLMVEKALKYEIERQSNVIDSGERVVKETRGWNDGKGKTVPQRTKEGAQDYRYFPEPDIPPLSNLEEEFAIELPESIDAKIEKWHSAGITQQDIETLLTDGKLLSRADEIFQTQTNPSVLVRSINLIVNIETVRSLPADFISDLAEAIESGAVGQPAVQPIIKMGVEQHLSVKEAIEKGGFAGKMDQTQLESIVKQIIDNNPQAVADYKAGKQNAIGYIVGQVMRQTQGKAEPRAVADVVKKMI